MLTFLEKSALLNRRAFLQVGGLGLGGLSLANLLAARAQAASDGAPVTDKSVVFLFLHGGPSQTETFDPKMTAPAGVRSATGEIATSLPGVTFGSNFPRLAAMANELAVVRSYRTGNGNHDIKPIVCNDTLGANMGALYARVAGSNHPETGMPTNAVLFPRAIDPERQAANQNFGKFTSSGALGAAFAPFSPSSGGSAQDDMKLHLERARITDRKNLLSQLDRIKRNLDSGGELEGVDKFRQQAFDTILGGVADAFDVEREDQATLTRYDTAPLVTPDQISRKWNNYNNYVDNAKTLGKLLLLSRRLCERGCGFVTVTTNFVWDMHSDRNNAGVEEGMQYMGGPLDYAVSAFLEDLKARGLSDKILLVVSGEMGRSPKINSKGGRDHWGGLSPLLLAGGGLRMGQVIGQSTRDAGEPHSTPIEMRHLIATIMHTLIDVGELRIRRNIPTEVARKIADTQPIRELV